jgi:mono/diheme cytochrome c family protein
MPRTGRVLRILALALSGVGLVGCVRGCPSSRPPIHVNPNMDIQPRYETQGESAFFYDGGAMRAPVPGTVARGQLVLDLAAHTGRDGAGEFLAVSPKTVDEALLARGADRFGIYCSPCHGKRGTGDGVLTERGAVPVPAFTEERVRLLSDGRIFDVITHGNGGLMSGYAYPIPPEDRWAIVAHVRHLQRKAETERAILAAR